MEEKVELKSIEFPKLEIKDNRIFLDNKDITNYLKSMNLNIEDPGIALAKLEIYVDILGLN